MHTNDWLKYIVHGSWINNDWLKYVVHTKQWLGKICYSYNKWLARIFLFIQIKWLVTIWLNKICCSYKNKYWLEFVVHTKKWLVKICCSYKNSYWLQSVVHIQKNGWLESVVYAKQYVVHTKTITGYNLLFIQNSDWQESDVDSKRQARICYA